MKKLESKQESFGSNKGVVLRKNEGNIFQNGYDGFEVKFNNRNKNLYFYFLFSESIKYVPKGFS